VANFGKIAGKLDSDLDLNNVRFKTYLLKLFLCNLPQMITGILTGKAKNFCIWHIENEKYGM